MMDSTSMGSVAERLMDFVSTTHTRDSNYDIAVLMLQNFSALKDMSIGEISDLCFVSKASITRFCRFMGFDGFKEFHRALQLDYSISMDYTRAFYERLTMSPEQALTAHVEGIMANLQNTLSAGNLKKIAQVSRTLHDSGRVMYFSHYFMWDIGRLFQSKMMRMGRYVECYLEYDSQYAAACTLQPTDLAIVCSIGGSYTLRHPTIWHAIAASKCKIVAVTQNSNNPGWNVADYHLECGVSNQDDTGKYSALLAMELVAMDYMRRYGKSYF